MERLNDSIFVRKLIEGDPGTFATLCGILKRKLPEFIVRVAGLNYHDAEEVASDVLFKVHSSVNTFVPRANAKLTTWVFEIARNAAIDRKRKLASQSSDDDGTQHSIAGKKKPNLKGPTQYEGEILRDRDSAPSPKILSYIKAFELLGEREKDILRMKHVLAYEEISVVEGEAVGALRTRHSRALRRLYELSNNGGDRNE